MKRGVLPSFMAKPWGNASLYPDNILILTLTDPARSFPAAAGNPRPLALRDIVDFL